MEMLFERLTAAVPAGQWASIVKEMNEQLGTARRPDNVRVHWNKVAKGKMLAGYTDGSASGGSGQADGHGAKEEN